MRKKSVCLFMMVAMSVLFYPFGKADIPPKTEEVKPQFLDKVYFGQQESEGDRVTVTDAPVIEGGLGVGPGSGAPNGINRGRDGGRPGGGDASDDTVMGR